jgi:hypothetical protein
MVVVWFAEVFADTIQDVRWEKLYNKHKLNRVVVHSFTRCPLSPKCDAALD